MPADPKSAREDLKLQIGEFSQKLKEIEASSLIRNSLDAKLSEDLRNVMISLNAAAVENDM